VNLICCSSVIKCNTTVVLVNDLIAWQLHLLTNFQLFCDFTDIFCSRHSVLQSCKVMMQALGLTLVFFYTVNTISASYCLWQSSYFLAGRKGQVMTRVNVALLFSVIDPAHSSYDTGAKMSYVLQ